jgi:adenylate cyclase
MPDLFLSYSRRDSDDALALVQRMRSAGLEVWIDQHGIGGASSWSGEIADAIRNSSVYAILLSPSSIESVNVKKELSVAAELRKPVLPIELNPIELTRDFLYHLAGIQRVQITDNEGIRAALQQAGLLTGSNGLPGLAKEDRKSLIILPFQDISSEKDNEWLAEGLASELLSSLSHIKSIRLVDQRTAADLVKSGAKPADIARELKVRYFVDGSVLKFRDQVKITVQVRDFVSDEYVWSQVFKGNFADIFDIQERVSEEVLKGIEVYLTPREKSKVKTRTTENAEAKELVWRADRFFDRHTKEMHEHAASQLRVAIELDPYYAEAHQLLALVYVDLYRLFDRRPEYLAEAEQLAKRANELDPELDKVFAVLISVSELKGDLNEAERYAKALTELAPDSWFTHYSVGLFYARTQRPEQAVQCYELALTKKPDTPVLYWNIALVARRSGDEKKLQQWARAGLPCFKQYLTLTPDDVYRQVQYANLLYYAGLPEEARAKLEALSGAHDAFTLYNLSCLAANLGLPDQALLLLQKATDAGFADLRLLSTDPDLDPIRQLPAFAVIQQAISPNTANKQEQTV